MQYFHVTHLLSIFVTHEKSKNLEVSEQKSHIKWEVREVVMT